MTKIIAIASGLFKPKKDYSEINKKNLYLNYGLLSICTVLKQKGFDVKQFQGEYLSPRELIERIEKTDYCLDKIDTPILLSIVSFYSLEWCREITHILKHEYRKKIILGGKYVVDGNIEWVKHQLPNVDIILSGDGESKILEVIDSERTKNDIKHYTGLDYSILHEFRKYNPSIELARGCGRGCRFCADAHRKVTKTKDAYLVIKEIQQLEYLYNHEKFSIYYQIPSLLLEENWINTYYQESSCLDSIHQWRCTSRIDELNPNLLGKMAEIGLKVIDLGLESASEKQLMAMGKTKNAIKYLQQADRLLDEANKYNIWVKFNILLSPGETRKTINETIKWLVERSKLIKGVSVNSEIIFGPNNTIMESYKKYGASFINPDDLANKGYAYMNLSKEISYADGKDLALHISQLMMTGRDYFDLKKFGYFSRYYSYNDFCEDIDKLDKSKLPFSDTSKG